MRDVPREAAVRRVVTLILQTGAMAAAVVALVVGMMVYLPIGPVVWVLALGVVIFAGFLMVALLVAFGSFLGSLNFEPEDEEE